MLSFRRLDDGRRVLVLYKPRDYPALVAYWGRIAKHGARRRVRRLGVGPRFRVDLNREPVALTRPTLFRRGAGSPVAEGDGAFATLCGKNVRGTVSVVPPAASSSARLVELYRAVASNPRVQRVKFEGRPRTKYPSAARVLALQPDGQTPTLPRPIGVFTHLFYPELTGQLADQLANISMPYALYITTTSEDKAAVIREAFPDAVIKVTPNAGRDVGAKFTAFRAEHDRHDVVLHLHGKRSRHLTSDAELDVGQAWYRHICDCILRSPESVNAIVRQFLDDPSLGMVAPAGWDGVRATTNWGHNRAIADVFTYGHGWPELPDDARLNFPVGSMFWARTDALRPILDLNLTSADFGLETGEKDGTLAHAIERLFGVGCLIAGYEFAYAHPPTGESLRLMGRRD